MAIAQARARESDLTTRLIMITVLVFGAPTTLCAEDIDFSRDVRPILADNCFECHGPDEASREGDLRLDVLNNTPGSVIVPGRPSESRLMERLLSDDDDLVMPPRESKRRPSAEQIEILKRWIAQGAPHERHWAFITPEQPDVPEVSDSRWPRNAIDSFVLAHLDSRSMAPNLDAVPQVLARRLSLALTGLPILPERSNQFAAAWVTGPDQAVAAFVDELLASPAYGEHFAWSWMDAARYADTNGYQADGYRIMWPWRDWLIRSLNENLPFNIMTEQMLAGDLLVPEKHQNWESADWIVDDRSSDLLNATGFLRNHRYDTGSGTIPDESKFENAADRMETVATVWMGLTMLCARCHTHKYDPIENHEYYRLLSFFDNVREAGAALRGASHPYIRTPNADQRAELKRLHAILKEAEDAFAAAEDQIRKEQLIWEAELLDDTAVPQPGARGESDGNSGVNSPTTRKRVTRGLRFHFAENPLSFDGRNSITESAEPIAMCAGNQRWTISFWFRPESESDGAIFSSVEEPERYRPGIQADWTNGKIRVRHVCRWVNSYIEYQSEKRLAIGRWHHVTFRSDGRMQGIAYSASLNGDDDAMTCTHPVTNDSAERAGKAPLVLGGSPLLRGFVGKLRDLRFYDRELLPAEVRSLADSRSLWEIAGIPRESRTRAEADYLRLAFLESSELPDELKTLQNSLIVARARLDEAIQSAPATMVMKEENTKQTRVRLAGVFDSLGVGVETATPAFLPPLPAGERNRLTLARWLTHPAHPLTARVCVNRIWQSLWGRGFVESPENFGTQSAKPLHDSLLDWLATEYIRSGWDTKALIRLIVNSRTFRQSSAASESAWSSDPENRHFARGPRYRMPVHSVRDQALFLSGRLDQTVGGPSVVLDEVIGQNGKRVNVPFEEADNRRTLYTFWKRNSPHPMLSAFDIADRNQCEVRALRTNTPLQALVTLNEPGFAASARALAERILAMSGAKTTRLRWLWQACTGRVPTEPTIDRLQQIHQDYVAIADGNETLAWTAICNVLLNLDATLTLE